jgi:hypothetical protein
MLKAGDLAPWGTRSMYGKKVTGVVRMVDARKKRR